MVQHCLSLNREPTTPSLSAPKNLHHFLSRSFVPSTECIMENMSTYSITIWCIVFLPAFVVVTVFICHNRKCRYKLYIVLERMSYLSISPAMYERWTRTARNIHKIKRVEQRECDRATKKYIIYIFYCIEICMGKCVRIVWFSRNEYAILKISSSCSATTATLSSTQRLLRCKLVKCVPLLWRKFGQKISNKSTHRVLICTWVNFAND